MTLAERDFWLLVTLSEVPLMLRMVADYVGDCWALRQLCWGPGICSWGMKTGGKIQWEERSVRCASFNQPWDKRAPVCINFEKETIWPHLGWPTQRDCLLIHRSVLLEEQKSSKRGKEIWGLSPTQALSSVTVNRSCLGFNIIWVLKMAGPHHPLLSDCLSAIF